VVSRWSWSPLKSQDHVLGSKTGLETKTCDLNSVLVSNILLLVSHSWSCQSVADLGVVHPVLVLNLKFYHRKFIHISDRSSEKVGRWTRAEGEGSGRGLASCPDMGVRGCHPGKFLKM